MKKRYWVLNARDGKDYTVDANSIKEVANKLHIPRNLIVLNRMVYLKTTGQTLYDIPFQGY